MTKNEAVKVTELMKKVRPAVVGANKETDSIWIKSALDVRAMMPDDFLNEYDHTIGLGFVILPIEPVAK